MSKTTKKATQLEIPTFTNSKHAVTLHVTKFDREKWRIMAAQQDTSTKKLMEKTLHDFIMNKRTES